MNPNSLHKLHTVIIKRRNKLGGALASSQFNFMITYKSCQFNSVTGVVFLDVKRS